MLMCTSLAPRAFVLSKRHVNYAFRSSKLFVRPHPENGLFSSWCRIQLGTRSLSRISRILAANVGGRKQCNMFSRCRNKMYGTLGRCTPPLSITSISSPPRKIHHSRCLSELHHRKPVFEESAIIKEALHEVMPKTLKPKPTCGGHLSKFAGAPDSLHCSCNPLCPAEWPRVDSHGALDLVSCRVAPYAIRRRHEPIHVRVLIPQQASCPL